MTIDWSKPVQTRDGRKVRILCMNAKTIDNRPVCVLYDNDGSECAALYTREGKIPGFSSDMDLVNVPEERWVNLYHPLRDGPQTNQRDAFVYPSKEEAEKRCGCAGNTYIGTFRLVEE